MATQSHNPVNPAKRDASFMSLRSAGALRTPSAERNWFVFVLVPMVPRCSTLGYPLARPPALSGGRPLIHSAAEGGAAPQTRKGGACCRLRHEHLYKLQMDTMDLVDGVDKEHR